MTHHPSLPATDDRNPVDLIADEFAARLRRGESPSMAEYVAKYPDHATEIEELFPGVALLEQLSQKQDSEAAQTHRPHAAGLPPGYRFGEIEIIREVGRGGMGVVYEAFEHSLHRPVAVKAISGSAVHSANQVARFQREAQAAAQLHHTNIVPVFGVGEQDGTSYYVMQLIHGVGLDAVLTELSRKTHRKAPHEADGDTTADSYSARELADVLVSGQLSESSVRAAGGGTTLRAGRTSDATVAFRQDEDNPNDPTVMEPCADEGITGRTDETGTLQDAAGDTPQTFVHSSHVLRDESRPAAGVRSSLILRDELSPASEETFIGAAADNKTTTGEPTSADVVADTALSALGMRYWRNVARIGVQVASGLQYAHSQGTLHRDIKPANILLDAEGTAWIADFGLAKVLQQEDVTKTGDVVGTLRYMAPEQFRGESDGRSDLYGLGLTLYELLTLRPADDDTDRQRLIAKKLTPHDPPHPRKLHPGIPRDLETIVLKCLAWEPDGRYQTGGALVADLQAFLEDRPISARRISQAERFWRWCKRNPVVAGLSTAVALLLLTITGLMSVGYVRAQERAEQMAALSRKADEQRLAAEKSEQLAQQKAAEADEARATTEQIADIQWEALNRIYETFVPDRFAGPVEATSDTDEETGLETQTSDMAVLSPQTAVMLEEMLTSFDKIAKIRGGNDERYLAETAKANFKVADLHLRLGQDAEAVESFERAKSRYEQLRVLRGADAETSYLLARMYTGLGIARQKLHEMSAARDALTTSLALLTSPQVDSTDPNVRLETAVTHYMMGRRPRWRMRAPPPRDGDGPPPPGGRERRGRGGRGGRGRSDPSSRSEPSTAERTEDGDGGPPRPDVRRDGEDIRRGPGGDRDHRRTLERREHLLQAVAILERLIAEYPAESKYRFLSAQCHLELSHSRSVPDADGDDQILDKAIAILTEVVEESPDDPDYLYQLSEAYEERYKRWKVTFQPLFLQRYPQRRHTSFKLQTPTDLTNIAAAEADLRNAIAVSDTLMRQQPNVAAYAESHRSLLFNLADVLTAEHRPQEALELLAEADQLLRTIHERFPDNDGRSNFFSGLNELLRGRALIDVGEPAPARDVLKSLIEQIRPRETLDERQRRFDPMQLLNRPAHLILADAYDALGDEAAAAQARTDAAPRPDPDDDTP